MMTREENDRLLRGLPAYAGWEKPLYGMTHQPPQQREDMPPSEMEFDIWTSRKLCDCSDPNDRLDPNCGCSGPCQDVFLVCNSISASLSKCGFDEFSGFVSSPPKIYLHRTARRYGSSGMCCRTSDPSLTCIAGTSHDTSPVYEGSVDPATCELTQTFGVFTQIQTQCDGASSTVTASQGWPSVFVPTSATHSHDSFSSSLDCGSSCTPSSISQIDSTDCDLDTEYTIDLLKSSTVDALPDYYINFGCEMGEGDPPLDTGQNCLCTAYAHLSEDENINSIQRFKYLFRTKEAATGYLKIYWNQTFKPVLTGDVTFDGGDYHAGDEDPDPANWICEAHDWTWDIRPSLGDPTMNLDSSIFEVIEPADNGTVYITDIRWSTDDTYDPLARSPCGLEDFTTTDDHMDGSTPGEQNCTAAA
jgi:hypothetical protein